MPQPNQRIGEYVPMGRIGQGAFGEVWKAHHGAWADQIVAIKIPTDPQFIRSFQGEGYAVHRLSHPNIVRALNFDPYSDPPYLVMEYVPGTSLRALIERGPMPLADAVAVMTQVLDALDHRPGRNSRPIEPGSSAEGAG
jgi:serine/threonine-protein kinase